MLIGPNNVALSQSLCFGFKATCNQAKYKALLAGLRVLAKEVEARRVRCRSDSKIAARINKPVQSKLLDKESLICQGQEGRKKIFRRELQYLLLHSL
ncbi:hypothetical protein JHK82_050268 [Glycine max]|nr:hypothetical protein JHK85_050905 [Glycine max]KAG5091490.1 hypothetical protein JHK82_050268 [Glycine max]